MKQTSEQKGGATPQPAAEQGSSTPSERQVQDTRTPSSSTPSASATASTPFDAVLPQQSFTTENPFSSNPFANPFLPANTSPFGVNYFPTTQVNVSQLGAMGYSLPQNTETKPFTPQPLVEAKPENAIAETSISVPQQSSQVSPQTQHSPITTTTSQQPQPKTPTSNNSKTPTDVFGMDPFTSALPITNVETVSLHFHVFVPPEAAEFGNCIVELTFEVPHPTKKYVSVKQVLTEQLVPHPNNTCHFVKSVTTQYPEYGRYAFRVVILKQAEAASGSDMILENVTYERKIYLPIRSIYKYESGNYSIFMEFKHDESMYRKFFGMFSGKKEKKNPFGVFLQDILYDVTLEAQHIMQMQTQQPQLSLLDTEPSQSTVSELDSHKVFMKLFWMRLSPLLKCVQNLGEYALASFDFGSRYTQRYSSRSEDSIAALIQLVNSRVSTITTERDVALILLLLGAAIEALGADASYMKTDLKPLGVLLDLCYFENLRVMSSMFPDEETRGMFKKGLKALIDVNRHYREFKWGMSIPFLLSDYDRSALKALDKFTIIHLDYLQQLKEWKKKFAGQEFKEKDLEGLVNYLVQYSPNWAATLDMYVEFVKELKGAAPVYSRQLNHLISVLNFDGQNYQKLLDDLKLFLLKNPELFVPGLLAGLFKNEHLLSLGKTQIINSLDLLVLLSDVHEADGLQIADEEELYKAVENLLQVVFCSKPIKFNSNKKKREAQQVKELGYIMDFWKKVLSVKLLSSFKSSLLALIKTTSLFTWSQDLELIQLLCRLPEKSVAVELLPAFTEKATLHAQALASNFELNQEKIIKMLTLVEEETKEQESTIKDHITVALLSTLIGEMQTSLSHVLQCAQIWIKVFELNVESKTSGEKCVSARHTILINVDNFMKDKLTFIRVRQITASAATKQAFVSLAQQFEKSTKQKITMQMVEDKAKELAVFDNQLSLVQTFARNFLQNSLIDVEKLNNQISTLLELQGTLVFNDNKGAFHQFPFILELNLYNILGQSEVFLVMWNQEIENLYQQGEVKEQEDDISEDFIEMEMPIVPAQKPKLTIAQLYSKVAPVVKRRWLFLYESLTQKSITFIQLQEMFGKMNSEAVKNEIVVMEKTRPILIKNAEVPAQWGERNHKLITGFIKILQRKNNIPEVIKFLKLFQPVFAFNLESDPFFRKLNEAVYILDSSWNTGTLNIVESLIGDVESCLEKFSDAELKLVSALNGGDTFLKWLFEHSNTKDFQDLIRVCRGNTDDGLMISNFAALQESRNYLLPILYPNQKFPTLDKFLDTFKSLNAKLEPATIEVRRKDVALIKTNIEQVLEVFRDRTRSPGISSIYALIDLTSSGGVYVVDTSRPKENMIETRDPKSGKKMYYDTLLDMRLTVLNTEVPKELKEKHPDADYVIDNFSKQVTVLSKIKNSLLSLAKYGHFYYANGYATTFEMKAQVYTMEVEAHRLREEEQKWKECIEAARENHYFLNFFNMKEVVRIIELLNALLPYEVSEADMNVFKLRSLLRLIQRTIDTSLIIKLVGSWRQVMSKKPSPENQLNFLGATLYELFALQSLDIRPLKVSNSQSIDLLSGAIKEQNLNVVVLSAADNEVENVIFSLFAHKKRLPEPEELIICDESTQLEDILLLLRRWKDAKLHGRHEDRTYVLGHIEMLSYSLQSQVVDAIKRFLPANNSSTLILVSAQASNQRLVSAFSSYCFEGNVLLKEADLRQAYAVVCEPGNYSGGIYSVKSTLPGGGKTFEIIRRCYESSSLYSRISLREFINVGELVARLERSNYEALVGWHFDVASFVSRKANALLFELIICGTIRDRNECIVFHRRESDSLYIELPSSPANRTEKKLVSITSVLPTILLDVVPQQLNLMSYQLVKLEDNKSFDIKQFKNLNLIYVCKYLRAFERGDFSNSIEYDPELDSTAISEQECFTLLRKYSANEQPSFALFRAFVEFTCETFKAITQANFLSIAALQEGLQGLKQCIITLLLETARDFAVRNINLTFKEDITQDISPYIDRFKTLKKWDQSKHPIMIFMKQNWEVSGMNVISLDNKFVERFIPQQFIQILAHNGLDILFDFEEHAKREGVLMSEIKCLSMLKQVNNMEVFDAEYDSFANSEFIGANPFVLTEDNLLKMIAISLRFQAGLPTIISGETGCGKTFLIEYLCKFLGAHMRRITVHGGISDKDILDFMKNIVVEAQLSTQATYVAFIDECNTCNSMGLMKEILCDRFLDGERLPENVKVIAALNPYRFRNESEDEIYTTGLVFKHYQSSFNIPDPLEKLCYRVYPVPDSFSDFMFDFGTLPPEIEKQYIGNMVQKTLRIDLSGATAITREVLTLFVELISESQKFIRMIMNEVSSVSLRDVDRVIKLFRFFDDSLAKPADRAIVGGQIVPAGGSYSQIFMNILFSLAHVYYCRLSRPKREKYLKRVHDVWKKSGKCHGMNFKPENFKNTLISHQAKFTENMNPGPGISLNESLCENVFMLFVSILNRIPIIVVGAPGSSKSLAMDLIAQSMKGKSSSNSFNKRFPNIDSFTYQCSPLSTADGIEQVFTTARSYAKEAKNSLVVVLLDEIGLAEQSPHLPLKVLHKELEVNDVAVVAISNFTLDSSKMNRCVYLQRSPPTTEDLKKTALGIVNNKQFEKFLYSIAESYKQAYTEQGIKDFWGLRDMYAMVKNVNSKLLGGQAINEGLMLNSILRNFGGRPNEDTAKVLDIFSKRIGIPLKIANAPSSIELVKQNLKDVSARHLMLLTKNNAALSLLFDLDVLSMKRTEVIFGSDFPDDNSNYQISLDLQRIKLCMSEGWQCVLVHCEALYESLYDLLNQHYQKFEGRNFSRIAFGKTSQTVPVHDSFRIIIIAEQEDAYKHIAAPLLNRLEKQVFLRDNFQTAGQAALLEKLQLYVSNLLKSTGMESSQFFIGSHKHTLISLVQSLEVTEKEIKALQEKAKKPKRNTDLEDVDDDEPAEEEIEEESGLSAEEVQEKLSFDKAVEQLMWIASPEAILATQDEQLIRTYFTEQTHSCLADFMNVALASSGSSWAFGNNGMQVVVQTYSTGGVDVEGIISLTLSKAFKPMALRYVVLHEMGASQDFLRSLDEFVNLPNDEALLVIVCDCNATSMRRINFARYACESKRDKLTNGKTRHIMFLVNLIRNSTQQQFSFDFDKRWKYLFIDDIRGTDKKLPNTSIMVSTSLSNIFANHVSIEEVVRENLHHALSKVIYPVGSNIKSQITTLKKLLNEDTVFLNAIIARIKDIIKNSHKDDRSWYASVTNKELAVAGTYQNALHYHISRICFLSFAAILAYIDRNENIQVLVNDEKNKQIWYSMLEQVDSSVLERYVEVLLNGQTVDVKFDERINHFAARFPFSFMVCSFANSMQTLVESIPGNTDEHLMNQLTMVFPKELCSQQGEELLWKYLSDYTQMYAPPVWERALLLDIAKAFVKLEYHAPSNIAQVQAGYWKNEVRIKEYFNMIDCVPTIVAPLLEILNESHQSKEIADILYSKDVQLCEIVLKAIDPKNEIEWSSIKSMSETTYWMQQVTRLRSSVNTLLSEEWYLISKAAPELFQQRRQAVFDQWKKIQFFFTFLRDLAIPLEMSSKLCQEFWERVSTGQFQRSKNAFLVLLKTLSEFNKELSRKNQTGEDFECIMCYEIPSVIRSTKCCKKVICAECATQYTMANMGKEQTCMWCRTHVNLHNVEAYTISATRAEMEQLARARSKENHFIKHASSLIETYVVDYCLDLNNAQERLSEEIIEMACQFVSEDETLFGERKNLLQFIVSDSLINAVVRRLLTRGAEIKTVEKCLEVQLIRLYALYNSLEFPLATCISQVYEDIFDTLTEKDTFVKLLSLKSRMQPAKYLGQHAAGSLKTAKEYRFIEALYNVAYSRVVIRNFASEVSNSKNLSQVSAELVGLVDGMFSFNERGIIFFMKEVTAKKGLSFTRQLMNQPLLKQMKSIQAYAKANQSIYGRFTNLSDSLGNSNPFPVFYKASTDFLMAVEQLRVSGNGEPLTALIAAYKNKNHAMALLLTSIFEGVVLRHSNAKDQGITNTLKWLSDTKSKIAKAKVERKIYRLLTCLLDNQLEGFKQENAIGSKMSAKCLWMMRAAVHVLAAILHNSSDMKFLYNLAFSSSSLLDSYLPTMHEDILQVVKSVLGTSFYSCPNGHKYYVSECGKPMEERKCAYCDAKIGGTNHNLLTTNKQVNFNQDSTPKNYTLRAASEEADVFYVVRKLNPKQARAIRFIMHSLLFFGVSMSAKKNIAACKQLIAEYATPKNIHAFFWEHLNNDFAILSKLTEKNFEEVSILLHSFTSSLERSETSSKPKFQTAEERELWETQIGTVANATFENSAGAIHKYYDLKQKSAKEQEAADYIALDIMEMIELPPQQRALLLPSIWMLFKKVTFSHFQLQGQQTNSETLTLLRTFLQREEQIRATRYIPDIVRLYNLVLQKYNRRISREAARELTIKEVLETLKETEKAEWRAAFDGFKAAFNAVWKYVDYYKCLPIPAIFKDQIMDDSKPITFFLPNEKDESLCALALLKYLIDTHNQVIEEADKLQSLAQEQVLGSVAQSFVAAISSRYVTRNHVITYTIEETLLPYIKDHSNRPLQVASGKQKTNASMIDYDYPLIQNYILDHLLIGKPLIELEIPTMEFLGEMKIAGARQRLNLKIKQEELLTETKNFIIRVVGNNSKVFRYVEMAINYLLATGSSTQALSSVVGEKLLVEYLAIDLLIEDAASLFGTCSKLIKLKHLDSLWKALERHLTNDIFADVVSAYREKLPEQVELHLVKNVCPKLELHLMLKPLQTFIQSYLTEQTMSADMKLKECIGYITIELPGNKGDALLSDLKWFENAFPEDLKMKHCLATYLLFEKYTETQKKL